MKKAEKQKEKANNISRKEMIKKLGLTAFSAATMILLLNDSAKADSGASPDLLPDWVDGLSDAQAEDIINALAEEEAKKKAKRP